MSRAHTKQELQEFGEREYQQLTALAASLTTPQRTAPLWSDRDAKDVLAHLHDWHGLLLGWIEQGKTHDQVKLPAPGFTWRDTPALNEQMHQAAKNKPWAQVVQELADSHAQVMALLDTYSAPQLEEKGQFKWTGGVTLASYFASATSSHYVWAAKWLKKAARGPTT